MMRFEYYNPTRIVFGKDSLARLDRLIPASAKVLVLYGGGSAKKYGTIDKVREALGKRQVVEFGGIEPNPHFTTLMRAVEVVRAEQINFLLAVGGGSVMDGTKFIALASKYAGPGEDVLYSRQKQLHFTEALPLGTVVTLPATGSEMNCGAVISHEGGKYVFSDPLVFPRFSLLDPTLTFTLPRTQVANGIVDSFVHTAEQYVTIPADAQFQDRTAEGIFRTLIEIGRTTLDNPTDYDARANLMWCATNALNGLIGAGVPQDWSTHMIGHELTAMFGIDHAKTLAIVMPALWTVRAQEKAAKLLQFGERVWDIRKGTEAERIAAAIAKTRNFFEELGVPTRLSAYNIGKERIDDLIRALEAHGMTALGEEKGITLEVSRKILETAL